MEYNQEKLWELFNDLELEEANALNRQDSKDYQLALAKKETFLKTLETLNITMDGISK